MLCSAKADVSRNEAIEHLWLQLETLWRNTRPDAISKFATEAACIDDLIGQRQSRKWRSGPEDWALVNEVEQRIGCLLNDEQLFTQFQELTQTARERKLPSLDAHEKNGQDHFLQPPAAPLTTQQHQINRDVYLHLLTDLQDHFVRSRFERRLRREAAASLSRAGIYALVAAATILGVGYVLIVGSAGRSSDPGTLVSHWSSFALLIATVFGGLGAYFSRLMRFQATSLTLGFAEFQANFIRQMMIIRIMTGLFGALVFYYLIRSGLVGGDALPDLASLEPKATEPTAAQSAPGTGGSAASVTFNVLAPGKELAKLIVWSFLAGFSERLVPDALGKTEGQKDD